MSIEIPQFIGTTEGGKHLRLHKDAVTQGFAILGKRGKGKSNLLGCMLEIFAQRKQSFVVLDPPDAHWGIRFAADRVVRFRIRLDICGRLDLWSTRGRGL